MTKPLSERWQALFWRGAIAVTYGVAAFGWPLMTVSALLMMFGLFALVDGGLALVLAAREAPRRRWSSALIAEGALGIIAGAVALLLPAIALSVAVALVATWAVVTGVLELVAATGLHRSSHLRNPLMVGGAISIAAGLIIAARPTATAIAIAWVLGAYALLFGVLLLVIAFHIRNAYRVLNA
jgi:uncharacterized membrane protein HdeD (DUF308 family)